MNLLILTSYLFLLPFIGAYSKGEYLNSVLYFTLFIASILCLLLKNTAILI